MSAVIEDQNFSEELAEVVSSAMERKGVTIRELSKQLGVVYEHGRRIARGFPPSKPMLHLVCKILDLDFDEMEELVVKASIRRKFGDAALLVANKDPELEPIERNWKHLTQDQKDDVVSLVKTMAKRNRVGK